MDTTRFRALARALTAMLLSAPAANTLAADYDFSITYSGMTISGRIVGLPLDMAGNANAADPTSVLLYQVPDIVGLPASPTHPYVLTPYWYGSNGSQTYTSTPGVFGFNVSHFQILPNRQDLLLADAGFDVFMEFNFGTISTGVNWGIAAQENAIWPAQDTTATFTLVNAAVNVPVAQAVPEPSTGTLSAIGALVVGTGGTAPPQGAPSLIAPCQGPGQAAGLQALVAGGSQLDGPGASWRRSSGPAWKRPRTNCAPCTTGRAGTDSGAQDASRRSRP